MSRCDEIQGRLDDWLDGLLEPAEQEHVAAHLQDCAACRLVFERHQRISEDLQAMGQLADRMAAAAPREATRSERRWHRVGRVAAAVLIVGTIGIGAMWHRWAPRAELIVQAPAASRPAGSLGDKGIRPRTAPGRREALVCLVKGDDRLAVRLPSKNPRVQIVWFYEPVRPKVENPEHEDEGTDPSS